MNLLIDINHPAHVHLFRNAMKIWQDHGHEITIAIRDRKLVAELLKSYGFDYVIASPARKGTVGLALELLEHDRKIYQLVKEFKIDLMLGTSFSISHVSRVTSAKSIVFCEDDPDYYRSMALLSYPFADTIVNPAGLRGKKTSKYVIHESYQKLAYLHPNRFQPDPDVLVRYGMKLEEPFFVLRLVEFMATHDVANEGLSLLTVRRLIEYLKTKGTVFVSAEGMLPEEFSEYRLPVPSQYIHHVLSYATMVISDSQTMTIEAAVLGTPAIRVNTFVGKCSVIEELEHRFGLTYGFLPRDEENLFRKIDELLKMPNLKEEWKRRKNEMLSVKIDLTEWMVNFIEDYFNHQESKLRKKDAQ